MVAFLIKGIVICAIVLLIGSYLVYLKTGQFWLPTMPSLSLPYFGGSPTLESIPTPKEPVYKWRQGNRWVYGDKPPKNVAAVRVFNEYTEDVE